MWLGTDLILDNLIQQSRLKLVVIVGLICLSAWPARGQSPWARMPSEAESASLLPKASVSLHEMSMVALLCRLGNEGALNDCWVLDQNPAGFGLGEAAVGAASLTRFSLGIENGAAMLGQPIQVDMVFDLGGSAPHKIFPHLGGVGAQACDLISIGDRAPPTDYRSRCLAQIAAAEHRSP